MRALLALAVFAIAAPTAANACGMVLREESVNLADLMEDVDETPAQNLTAVATPVVEEIKVEVVEVETTEAAAEAQPQAQTEVEVPAVEPEPQS